jgi:hypothetical protein
MAGAQEVKQGHEELLLAIKDAEDDNHACQVLVDAADSQCGTRRILDAVMVHWQLQETWPTPAMVEIPVPPGRQGRSQGAAAGAGAGVDGLVKRQITLITLLGGRASLVQVHPAHALSLAHQPSPPIALLVTCHPRHPNFQHR